MESLDERKPRIREGRLGHNYKLQSTNYKVQITKYELQIINYKGAFFRAQDATCDNLEKSEEEGG